MRRLISGLLASMLIFSEASIAFASNKYTSYEEDGRFYPLSQSSAYETYGTISKVGLEHLNASDLDDLRAAANADRKMASANDTAKLSGEKVNLDTQKALYGMGTLVDFMSKKTVSIEDMETFAWSFVISQFAEPYVDSLLDVFDHDVFFQMQKQGLELDPTVDASSGSLQWTDLFGSGTELLSSSKFNEVADNIKESQNYSLLLDSDGVSQLNLYQYLTADIGSIFYIRDTRVGIEGIDNGTLWMNRNNLVAQYSSDQIVVEDILIPVYVQSNVNAINNQLNLSSFLKGQVTGEVSDWSPTFMTVIGDGSGSMGSSLMYVDAFGNICCYHNNKMKMILSNAQNTLWSSFPDEDDESWLNSSTLKNITGEVVKGSGESIESVLEFSMFSDENGEGSQYFALDGSLEEEKEAIREYIVTNLSSYDFFKDITAEEALTVYSNECLNVYNKPWMTSYTRTAQTGAWNSDQTIHYTGGSAGVLNDYPQYVQFATAAQASKRNSVVLIKPSYLIEEAEISTSKFEWDVGVVSNNSNIDGKNEITYADKEFQGTSYNDKLGIATMSSLASDNVFDNWTALDRDHQRLVVSHFRWNPASAVVTVTASDDAIGGDDTYVEINMKHNISKIYKNKMGIWDATVGAVKKIFSWFNIGSGKALSAISDGQNYLLPALSTGSSRITEDGLIFSKEKDVVYNNAMKRSLPITYWSSISSYGEKFDGLTPWIRYAGVMTDEYDDKNNSLGENLTVEDPETQDGEGEDGEGEDVAAEGGNAQLSANSYNEYILEFSKIESNSRSPINISSREYEVVDTGKFQINNIDNKIADLEEYASTIKDSDTYVLSNDIGQSDSGKNGNSGGSSGSSNGGSSGSYTGSKSPIGGTLGEGHEIVFDDSASYTLELPLKLLFEPGYNRSVLALMSSDLTFVNNSMFYSIAANESGGKAYSVGSMYSHSIDYGQYWTAVSDALSKSATESYITGLVQMGPDDAYFVKNPAQTSDDESVALAAGLLLPYLKEYCTLSETDIEALQKAVSYVGEWVDWTEPNSCSTWWGGDSNYWYDPDVQNCKSDFHPSIFSNDSGLVSGKILTGENNYGGTPEEPEKEIVLTEENLACLIRGWLNSYTNDSKDTGDKVLRESMIYYDQLVMLLRDTRIDDVWTIYGVDDVSLITFVWMNYYLPKSLVFRTFVDGTYDNTKIFENFQKNFYNSWSQLADNTNKTYDEFRENNSDSNLAIEPMETIFGDSTNVQWPKNTVIMGPYIECFGESSKSGDNYSISLPSDIAQRFNYKLYPDTSPTPCLVVQSYIQGTPADGAVTAADVVKYGQNYVSINVYDLFMGVYKNTNTNLNLIANVTGAGGDNVIFSKNDILSGLWQLVRYPGSSITNIISSILQFAHSAMTGASFANFFQLSWLTNTEYWQTMLKYYFIVMLALVSFSVVYIILKAVTNKQLRFVDTGKHVVVNIALVVLPLFLVHGLVFTTDSITKTSLSASMDKSAVAETSAYVISKNNQNAVFEAGYQMFRDNLSTVEDTLSQYSYQTPKTYLASVNEFVYANQTLQNSLNNTGYSQILSQGLDRWYDYRNFVPVHKKLYSEDLYYYFYDFIKWQYLQYLSSIDEGQSIVLSSRAYEYQFGADPSVIQEFAGDVPNISDYMQPSDDTVDSGDIDIGSEQSGSQVQYKDPSSISSEGIEAVQKYLDDLGVIFSQEMITKDGDTIVGVSTGDLDAHGTYTHYLEENSNASAERNLYIRQLEKSMSNAQGNFIVMMTDPTYIYGTSFSSEYNKKYGGYYLEDMFGLGRLLTDKYEKDERWEPSDELYEYLGWIEFKEHSALKEAYVGELKVPQNTNDYIEKFDYDLNVGLYNRGGDYRKGKVYGSKLALMDQLGYDLTVDKALPMTELEQKLDKLNNNIYDRVRDIIRFFPAETTDETYISLAAMAASFEFTKMFGNALTDMPLQPTGFMADTVTYNSVLRGVFSRSPSDLLNSREIMYLLVDNNNFAGILPCIVIFLSDIAAFVLALMRNATIIIIFVFAILLSILYYPIQGRKDKNLIVGLATQVFGLVFSHLLLTTGLNIITDISVANYSIWKDTLMALSIFFMFVADSYVHFMMFRAILRDPMHLGGKIFAESFQAFMERVQARMNKSDKASIKDGLINNVRDKRNAAEEKYQAELAKIDKLNKRIRSTSAGNLVRSFGPGWMRLASSVVSGAVVSRSTKQRDRHLRKAEGLREKIGKYDAVLNSANRHASIGSDMRFDGFASYSSNRDRQIATKAINRLSRHISRYEGELSDRSKYSGVPEEHLRSSVDRATADVFKADMRSYQASSRYSNNQDTNSNEKTNRVNDSATNNTTTNNVDNVDDRLSSYESIFGDKSVKKNHSVRITGVNFGVNRNLSEAGKPDSVVSKAKIKNASIAKNSNQNSNRHDPISSSGSSSAINAPRKVFTNQQYKPSADIQQNNKKVRAVKVKKAIDASKYFDSQDATG